MSATAAVSASSSAIPAAVLKALAQSAGKDRAITQGQRIFYTGHSFHTFIPGILQSIAESAGIVGQENLGVSGLGASRVINHWNVPEEKNHAKMALATGKVDVLTMAPILMPDDGIEKFTTLALEKNPGIRITVQEDWLGSDHEDPYDKRTCDYDAITGAELLKIHAPLFKSIDDTVAALNQKLGKTVLYIVPAGQAVIALRERIRTGKGGGLKTQTELFHDHHGHPGYPTQLLVAYCHYAVIYRRSPVGLPRRFLSPKPEWNDETLRVLQEVAWEAVTQHPQSGVCEAKKIGNDR